MSPDLVEQTGGAAAPFEEMKRLIRGMGSVVVGYSGGVDSTFLLHTCVGLLGRDAAVAVLVDHPLLRDGAVPEAIQTARGMGADVRVIRMDLLRSRKVSMNGPDRCYHCKKIIFAELSRIARSEGIGSVLDGTNADDTGVHRPGRAALRELAVRSPLAEAGLGKDLIRELSREAGLPTWDRPSAPCLATRFPYGTRLTTGRIERVRRGEKTLADAGFRDLRLRDHTDGDTHIARIEIPPHDRERLLVDGIVEQVVASLRGLGYRYVTLDLEGLRSGGMDEGMDNQGP